MALGGASAIAIASGADAIVIANAVAAIVAGSVMPSGRGRLCAGLARMQLYAFLREHHISAQRFGAASSSLQGRESLS